MRRRPLAGVLALSVAAGVALAAAPGAQGATRTLTLEGWHDRVLAFSGRHLVWTEAATVRVDPARIAGSPAGARRFDYYRAETSRVRLDRASRRFSGAPEMPVAVRTSIAAMTAGTLAPTGDGGFVAAPGSRRLAPPVVWCCDDEGIEVVIESDGRAAAPVTVAAGWTGSAVRFVQIDASGRQVLRLGDPAGAAVPPPVLSDPGAPELVAVAGADLRAWADPAQRARLLVSGAPGGGAAAAVALPGPALRVWAAPGLVAVLSRAGSRLALTRVDVGGRPPRARRAWTGGRRPAVAVGGGTLAIGDGRRVLVSRRGRLATRLVTTARRRVDAVGADGARLAWVERGRRKGLRVGIVRLARLG
ncbi:MAG TPA: hypothetical protein VHK00_10925 [Miltoncostaeaceae bacterium]|nr:hypothetical protein [Miltoncostaeaceae bacterium]